MAAELNDRAFAEWLQIKDDNDAMMETNTGKAITLVERTISLLKSMASSPMMTKYNIEVLARDDMVFFAERLIKLQESFIRQNIPADVDFGYHYTDEKNLPRIRAHSLLTKSDLQARSATRSVITHGSRFGDGIYTSNDSKAFSVYGNVGLLVGRLKGKTFRVAGSLSLSDKHGFMASNTKVANTIIGNRIRNGAKLDSNGWPVDERFNEIVLRTSAQCLPLIKYDASLVKSDDGKKFIESIGASLQSILSALFTVDRRGNHGCKLSPTSTTAVLPSRQNPTSRGSTNYRSNPFRPSSHWFSSPSIPAIPPCSSVDTEAAVTEGSPIPYRPSRSAARATSKLEAAVADWTQPKVKKQYLTPRKEPERKPAASTRSAARASSKLDVSVKEPRKLPSDNPSHFFSRKRGLEPPEESSGDMSRKRRRYMSPMTKKPRRYASPMTKKPYRSPVSKVGSKGGSQRFPSSHTKSNKLASPEPAVPTKSQTAATIIDLTGEPQGQAKTDVLASLHQPTMKTGGSHDKLSVEDNAMGKKKKMLGDATKERVPIFGQSLLTTGQPAPAHSLFGVPTADINSGQSMTPGVATSAKNGSHAGREGTEENSMATKEKSDIMTASATKQLAPIFGQPSFTFGQPAPAHSLFGDPPTGANPGSNVFECNVSQSVPTFGQPSYSFFGASTAGANSRPFLFGGSSGSSQHSQGNVDPSLFTSTARTFVQPSTIVGKPAPAYSLFGAPTGAISSQTGAGGSNGCLQHAQNNISKPLPTFGQQPYSFCGTPSLNGFVGLSRSANTGQPTPVAGQPAFTFGQTPPTQSAFAATTSDAISGRFRFDESIGFRQHSGVANVQPPATFDQLGAQAPSASSGPSGFGGAQSNGTSGVMTAANLSSSWKSPPTTSTSNAIVSLSLAAGAARATPSSVQPMGTLPLKTKTATLNTAHRTFPYVAPLAFGIPSDALITPPSSCNMKNDCVICHDQLSNFKCIALTHCGHVFHEECIQLAFKSKPQCPICRVAIGHPQGKSPSGTLEVSTSLVSCSGFNEGSIVLEYSIPPGRQCSYHESPGEQHSGKLVRAYLPNNGEGCDLLKRLIYAFMHGLTFEVGTSVTTGRTNTVTWGSIHHKTSYDGGVMKHGWPDPDYISNCSTELDGLGVPSADDLDDNGVKRN